MDMNYSIRYRLWSSYNSTYDFATISTPNEIKAMLEKESIICPVLPLFNI